MSNVLLCPHCRASYKTGGKSMGKRVKCKSCQTVFTAVASNANPPGPPEHDSGKHPGIVVDESSPPPTGGNGGDFSMEDAKTLWQDAADGAQSEGLSIKSEEQTPHSTGASDSVPIRSITKEGRPEAGSSDFSLIKVIGRGGMGAIFTARQAGMDRNIAVKMILPDKSGKPGVKEKFISEALVTGELDHPNIVPVHEVGRTSDGTLFYAMKEVKGTSWKDVIYEKSEDENIQILLDVCDAMAFAHDKGVVHRDLKPENIMLGDYGEVLVMDWGLAVCTEKGGKAEAIRPRMSKAGTPAYMAPEMASCSGAQIGPWSDIYLLGGILYEIATGLKPHGGGGNVYACIYRAARNEIQESRVQNKLVKIALKAMATKPEERYESVKSLQSALRAYQTHAESLRLSTAASRRFSQLDEIEKGDKYRECNEIIAGYQQAIELWPQNKNAIRGLREVREECTAIARERGDLSFAWSQVQAMVREARDLRIGKWREKSPDKLQNELSQEIVQQSRRQMLDRYSRWAAVGTAALVLLVVSFGYLRVSADRDRIQQANEETKTALSEAEAERKRAVTAEQKIRHEKERAEQALADMKAAQEGELLARKETEKVKEVAGEEKLALARETEKHKATAVAEKQKLATEVETTAYFSEIAAARAQIDLQELGKARTILEGTTKALRQWEWGWQVQHLPCSPEAVPVDGLESAPVALTADCRYGATRNQNAVRVWDFKEGIKIAEFPFSWSREQKLVLAKDGKLLIAPTLDRRITVWGVPSGKTLCRIPPDGGSYCYAISQNGARVATLGMTMHGNSHVASVWNARTGKRIRKFTVKKHPENNTTIYCFRLGFVGNSESRLLLRNHLSKLSKEVIWHLDTGNGRIRRELLSLEPMKDKVTDRIITPRILATSPDCTQTVERMSGGVPDRIRSINGNVVNMPAGGGIQQVFNSSGSLLARIGIEQGLEVYDTRTGKRLGMMSYPSVFAQAIAWHPDGMRLLVYTSEKKLLRWHLFDFARPWFPVIRELAFDEKQRYLVPPNDLRNWGIRTKRLSDGVVEIRDAKTKKVLLAARQVLDGALAAAGSPDGERAVVVERRGQVGLWDTRTGRRVMLLPDLTATLVRYHYSTKGNFKLKGGTVETHTQSILRFTKGRSPFGYWHVAFSPSGREITVRMYGSSYGSAVSPISIRTGYAVTFRALDWTRKMQDFDQEKRERWKKYWEGRKK